MEHLISIPFIAVLLGLFAADHFFVERYRKVIDAIKQETIEQKVSPALRKLTEELIDNAKTALNGVGDIDQFVLTLKEKLGEMDFIKLANLTQSIFEATEILRKTETIFDKYLVATKRTMIFSFILAMATILPLLSQCFIQQFLSKYSPLLQQTYYGFLILLFIFWAYYFLRCINSRCMLSRLWKNYI